MNNRVIDLLQVGEEYRIDSRKVAEGIDIEHETLVKTLRTYQDKLEYWGVIRFEIGKPPKGSAGGRPETYAMLNRNQVLFTITLSRNTEQVVDWKMALIDALDQLEKHLAAHQFSTPLQYLPSPLTDRQQGMLNLLQSMGRVTSGEWKACCEKARLGRRSFYDNAERLVQRGLVLKMGEGKGYRVYYEVAECNNAAALHSGITTVVSHQGE